MILPGATIGILGGGQLGRMTGLAARSLGYDVHVLDPSADCPAAAIASRVVAARFDDAGAAADLARGCSVVTLEIEQIGGDALDAVEAIAPLRPGASAVRVVQDRLRQKRWLDEHGFPVGAWRAATSGQECVDAVRELGASIAKSTTGGYDGRGQARIASADEAAEGWRSIGGRACVVEQFLDIDAELSVMVARSPSGETAAYPAALNHHENGILDWSVMPSGLPEAVVRRAEQVARSIAETLGIEGLIAVEMFLLKDRRLLVNELAPRPHNSFHETERACPASQFEQHVRAVCGLPLGSTEIVRPAAIANLLGDLWRGEEAPDFAAALRVPGVRLHLYGKRQARPGRKMGHLSIDAPTSDAAVAAVLEARRLLGDR